MILIMYYKFLYFLLYILLKLFLGKRKWHLFWDGGVARMV